MPWSPSMQEAGHHYQFSVREVQNPENLYNSLQFHHSKSLILSLQATSRSTTQECIQSVRTLHGEVAKFLTREVSGEAGLRLADGSTASSCMTAYGSLLVCVIFKSQPMPSGIQVDQALWFTSW
ncbi:hypothetical protein NC653_032938 [Populus alba x Populus x berolinensis]|uniref:Uncharacterized protein n=1 Tax=Populus alba x Populus x berolinensis TaxID=444605 RepID=A0AAD6LSF9_9ROSI|nr:hypothetical protein NC653_032938 [Populus alba x Populus x berolinensis]